MQTQRDRIALLDRLISESAALGIGHSRAEDERSDGRHVRIRGRDLLSFSSCSYLGLELDERLIEGAIDAMRCHGIETSASRAFLSSPLYEEFENLAEQIFQAHVVVAPTTTLAHLSALPVLVDEEDAIVMDHQVHATVQMACSFVRGSGAHLEVVRHNNLERLEERVVELSKSHRQVWYMADGVYSMFGDLSPNAAIVAMLDRHPQMRFYVDDAHGMSWSGPRGSGSVLNEIPLHPRMVLATGLAKGFGTGGGLIVVPDAEQKRRIRTCGPTMLFSGPMQPPILGAAIASAKIHLSDEIINLQSDLRERMDLCNALFAERDIPIISSPDTPVGFVGMGPIRACQSLCARLIDEGFYINPAQFPAAPVRRSGGRFLLTRHHELDDIEKLVDAVGRNWEASVRFGDATPDEVWHAFGLEPAKPTMPHSAAPRSNLYLESASSIEKLRREEWDRLMGNRGCVGSDALSVFETVFGPDASPENRWDFRYYIVRAPDGEPVLATCFTRAVWKADMLAPAAVSKTIEERRETDSGYLTQQVFGMGCLLSEGDHLWLRDSVDSETSREAIRLLLDAVRIDAQEYGCEVRVLRDFPNSAIDLASFMEGEGILRMPAPESLVLDDVRQSEADLVASLGSDHRRHQRRSVEPWNDFYRSDVIGLNGRALVDGEAAHLYRLYENVKSHSLELNTFGLPTNLLSTMATSPGWEIIVLSPANSSECSPVGFFASYVSQEAYVPVFAGLDYEYVRDHGLYRQLLRHAVNRARETAFKKVLFGFGAGLEKRRFGARPIATSMFVEADDHFSFDALAHMSSKSG